MCDSSPLPIHSSIPSTLATFSHFNYTDKVSQFVPHSHASRDFSDLSYKTKQNIESFCFSNHDIDSVFHVTSRSPDPEISPNLLSSPQIPPFSETVVTLPIRLDTVRFSTVRCIVRSDTELYNNVLGVFYAVQYGTPCNPDFVPIAVPFSLVEGLKYSKRNNTHYENKYNKKNRTPLIVPRIIEPSKDVDLHLDQ